MNNFRTYNLALELQNEVATLTKGKMNPVIKDQLERAAISVVLNLAEGSAKAGLKDRRRFFSYAFGSLREVQACLQILKHDKLKAKTDQLCGMTYRLLQNPGPGPVA